MVVKNMRILMKIAYNGTHFNGWQHQEKGRTVQGEIEAVLSKIHKTFTRIHPASRTDKGVHAKEQYAHFETALDIPSEKWQFILNSKMPGDIAIIETKEVPNDYHVRYDSKGKTYRYRVYQTEKNPFNYGLKAHVKKKMDLDKVREAAKYFIGEHDFTSFASAKTVIEYKVRYIYQLDIEETTDGFDIVITGSGFLYNMVRIIAAYLFEVGELKRDPKDTLENINNKDRTQNPRTAPPEGLYLERTFLNEQELQEYLKEIRKKH